jgi:hypothetical protein
MKKTPENRVKTGVGKVGIDGNAVKVEAQLSQADFIRKIKEFYGLSGPDVASAEDLK